MNKIDAMKWNSYKRGKEITRLFVCKWTYKRIANHLGISTIRVQQLREKYEKQSSSSKLLDKQIERLGLILHSIPLEVLND